MKHNRYFALLGSAIGILLLILDGQTGLRGASEGLELCIKTVIPSLFPFFVLSTVLTSSLLGANTPLLRPVFRHFGVPEGVETLVITGFLGGYPVGAQGVADAYRSRALSKDTAQRMLGFCNNTGPSFLFGMVGQFFPRRRMIWALWGIHILSALFAAILLPGSKYGDVKPIRQQRVRLAEAVSNSLRVMGIVCGWIVLFRVIIAFLNRWFLWLLPNPLQVCVTGFLELANGCCALEQIRDVNLRFILCAGMLAFGGVCVTMQTVSVTAGLSLRQYFLGKFIQTIFSVTLATIVCMEGNFRYSIALLLLILPTLLIQIRKRRCNQEECIV